MFQQLIFIRTGQNLYIRHRYSLIFPSIAAHGTNLEMTPSFQAEKQKSDVRVMSLWHHSMLSETFGGGVGVGQRTSPPRLGSERFLKTCPLWALCGSSKEVKQMVNISPALWGHVISSLFIGWIWMFKLKQKLIGFKVTRLMVIGSADGRHQWSDVQPLRFEFILGPTDSVKADFNVERRFSEASHLKPRDWVSAWFQKLKMETKGFELK